MSSKSFGGEDFGLGLSTVKPPASPAQPPESKVKKTVPTQETKIKPPAETSGYKRNSFENSGEMKLAAFTVNQTNAQNFKFFCAAHYTSASAVINNFISEYLTSNGGGGGV
jgi:hypothetical protein